LTWGNNVEFLQKRIEAGKAAPALENRPDVYEDLEDVWELFWQLHGCRRSGLGPCPLVITDIVTLFDLCGLPMDQRMETFELIKAMDVEWLAWANEQAKT